ncbi:protein kinase family protein/WD-40 repeat family protein [Forsythia ovata]|uniref:Protein kinase family protein/WD-40 repeat family protein n=1 Tax=Forsythia ovata TaxID=205694 RepID=A0ABD1WNJ2_9LAMI
MGLESGPGPGDQNLKQELGLKNGLQAESNLEFERQSNDFLLPILPAFLNDRDEQLRAVFYGQIIYVCIFVGQRSVEEYLLPYIEQALNDITEAVIVNALHCLACCAKVLSCGESLGAVDSYVFLVPFIRPLQ